MADIEHNLNEGRKNVQSNATLSTAAMYIKQGFVAPFPLGAGAKSPPATGFTGNVPAVTGDQVKERWKGIKAEDNANLAIRLQVHSDKDYEILSIDVDDYGSKRGDLNLSSIEKQLGSLNRDEIPRSSRRSPKSPSGQHFFRVPKGIKWEGKVCADVDVVQFTHRYAAVWPSVVEDGETGEPLQYKWYIGDQEVDVPNTDDLPELPEEWVRYLRKGTVDKLRAKAPSRLGDKNKNKHDAAVEWLSLNLPGWKGKKFDMSKEVINASVGTQVLDDMEGNAHDTMVSAMHNVIRLGVEGHTGIELALDELLSNFVHTVSNRQGGDSYRSEDQARKEFSDALIGEVESVINEIEDGYIEVSERLDNIEIPSLQEALVSSATEGKPQNVDWSSYGNNDSEHARMFHDYWGNECLATNAGGNMEFFMWDRERGRFVPKGKNQMFDYFRAAVPDRLYRAAEEQQLEADRLKVKMEAGQVEAETEEKMELAQSHANNLRKRADALMNTVAQKNVLDQLHSIEEISLDVSRLDSKRQVVGIEGGLTLDITKVKDGKPEEYLRRSKPVDWLTMSTRVTLQEGSTHPAWTNYLNAILPDKEIQTFVRKVMGYSFSDGNPEKLAIFLAGEANTGKSTVLLACQSALGDYASPVQTDKIYGRKGHGPTPEIIDAIDRLMVTMSETGDGDTLSSNSIKQITGNDQLQLRGAHQNDTINKSPRFAPYSSTNSPPRVTDADKALQGRILVLPFDHPQQPRVVDYDEDVVNNPAISVAVLAWMFEGYKDFVREGLARNTWPSSITQGSSEFSDTTNIMTQFVSDVLTKTDKRSDIVDGTKLYHRWKVWTENEGISREEAAIAKTTFYQKLKANGVPIRINTKIDGKNVTLLRGYTMP